MLAVRQITQVAAERADRVIVDFIGPRALPPSGVAVGGRRGAAEPDEPEWRRSATVLAAAIVDGFRACPLAASRLCVQ